MNRESVQRQLASYLTELDEMGVKSLELFGSVARGEAGPESDLDFLVEFSRPVGLFHFFHVQHRIEEILGVKKVDLIEKGAEHAALRARIREEAVRVA
ncbi:MAG TPA: nucleotidyltransferase family protein [Candidatus Hydrogenedentes bacterium]|nr:nucleotidyltransferase family protein [Candidatus Hydrogenedentota bacterium]HNT88328.1 nucleotidyltransferase family protein [Candidatus Hydrogenedentota bacterium]